MPHLKINVAISINLNKIEKNKLEKRWEDDLRFLFNGGKYSITFKEVRINYKNIRLRSNLLFTFFCRKINLKNFFNLTNIVYT